MKLENLKDTAEGIYLGFVEAEGGTDCPMQEAWNDCEEKYGPIKVGSPIDRLVLEAMVYALELARFLFLCISQYVGGELDESR